jgi:hypothetical protein
MRIFKVAERRHYINDRLTIALFSLVEVASTSQHK